MSTGFIDFPRPEEIVIDALFHQKNEILRLLQEGNGHCQYEKRIEATLLAELKRAGWDVLCPQGETAALIFPKKAE